MSLKWRKMYWKFQKLKINFDLHFETWQGKTRTRLWKKTKTGPEPDPDCLNPCRPRTRLFETRYITSFDFCYCFQCAQMFWIRKRPFLSQKAPKSAPIFFFKKRHNFGQRRHNLRLFLLAWNCKWPTMPFLLHFYVTISNK